MNNSAIQNTNFVDCSRIMKAMVAGNPHNERNRSLVIWITLKILGVRVVVLSGGMEQLVSKQQPVFFPYNDPWTMFCALLTGPAKPFVRHAVRQSIVDTLWLCSNSAIRRGRPSEIHDTQ